MHKIAVIAGDGVGPEVTAETLKVAEQLITKFQLPVTFEMFPYGADYYLSEGITIPESVFKQWPEQYSAILLGALGDPRVPSNIHARDILLGLRFKLDLYVNFRPVKLIDKRCCPLKHVNAETQVDFVVFRENIEDVYAGVGGCIKKDTPGEVAIENSIHTYKGVSRIIRAAFQYAAQAGRPGVVMSDKGNAMPHAGHLWQRVFWETSKEFPQIQARHMYIDALVMDIIRDPSRYSVIVTSNMFGDILTDAAAQVQGGMGLAASGNFDPGDEKFFGMFEPVHGSAPDIAGKGQANPIASILSFHLLLWRLGFHQPADTLYRAVTQTLDAGTVTPDLGGNCSTGQVGDAVCQYIR